MHFLLLNPSNPYEQDVLSPIGQGYHGVSSGQAPQQAIYNSAEYQYPNVGYDPDIVQYHPQRHASDTHQIYYSTPPLTFDFATIFEPTQTPSVAAGPSPSAECRWGSPCSVRLTDLSAAGIAWHLKQYHFDNEFNAWHDRRRGVCMWLKDNGSCSTELLYEGFGKHVASVHLKSIARTCPQCGRKYSRIDALQRHMRESCLEAMPSA
ncbi:predicted protein [Postia placenta Mad-698-R]|uniref:C2H2-type domain-containing protein n=1 Tax=Postia placenta MAD-698-R-SB12 TaxID=670580 RepID=A0A1X6MZ46_9APHY|nr:hypothetical protein POSPLADRAFT_1034112 [Postia placenta MAD-698-R-SB12]EED81381.1 predicted protein [Postia placenta Mad-698-R]OSX61463.1 hypothetical protein POSPLADRAFT_1034112 [Postia placenta MAD-698-R-SB12]